MRRDTPGARAWANKPRKPMRRESEKGRARREQWQRDRDDHRARFPHCQHHTLGGIRCWGPRDVHHIMPRGSGGTTGRTGPLVTLCRAHHDWVETHRAEARALGLLLRRD